MLQYCSKYLSIDKEAIFLTINIQMQNCLFTAIYNDKPILYINAIDVLKDLILLVQ